MNKTGMIALFLFVIASLGVACVSPPTQVVRGRIDVQTIRVFPWTETTWFIDGQRVIVAGEWLLEVGKEYEITVQNRLIKSIRALP